MSPSLKLAIIGAGPSAFYTASRILSSVPHSTNLRIHMYDRLWSPHGLVRYGVAPDHPEVKNCTHKFDSIAQDPRFRFFGNVNVNTNTNTVNNNNNNIPHALDISLYSLSSHYSHILFSTGCTIPTTHPSLPPSQYCTNALSLVHWYTQHPSRPSPPPLELTPHISLIGNGNVSLDIARILLSPPSTLCKYDIPSPVVDTLSHSAVKHVSIFARRGPLQAAFTAKEIRELINLPNASMVPLDRSIVDLDTTKGTKLTRQQSRILGLLQKGSNQPFGTTERTWSLDFFRSPIDLILPPSPSLPAQLTLSHTTIDPKTNTSLPTPHTSTIPTNLVITSLGFHHDPTNPFYDHKSKHLRTISGGRIVDDSTGTVVRNVYASGWASTGANGVLASTMMDAFSVADAILDDFSSPSSSPSTSSTTTTTLNLNPSPTIPIDSLPPPISTALQTGQIIEYPDWLKIDQEEVRRGEKIGKERERMREWSEVREFLGRGRGW